MCFAAFRYSTWKSLPTNTFLFSFYFAYVLFEIELHHTVYLSQNTDLKHETSPELLHETTHLVAAIRFDYSKSACTEHWCSLFQHGTTAGMPSELLSIHQLERK